MLIDPGRGRETTVEKGTINVAVQVLMLRLLISSKAYGRPSTWASVSYIGSRTHKMFFLCL
jgi:hypothetical protein